MLVHSNYSWFTLREMSTPITLGLHSVCTWFFPPSFCLGFGPFQLLLVYSQGIVHSNYSWFTLSLYLVLSSFCLSVGPFQLLLVYSQGIVHSNYSWFTLSLYLVLFPFFLSRCCCIPITLGLLLGKWSTPITLGLLSVCTWCFPPSFCFSHGPFQLLLAYS